MTDLDPRALVEIEIEAPASEIPELTQANLIDCLRYSAFKLCGKGLQEDYASEAMSMAADRLQDEVTTRNKISEWLRSLDKEGGEINRFLPTTLANWIDEGMYAL